MTNINANVSMNTIALLNYLIVKLTSDTLDLAIHLSNTISKHKKNDFFNVPANSAVLYY